MVAKIISGKSIRGLLNYNEEKVQKGVANLVLANQFGLEISQLDHRAKIHRFECLTQLNSRVKTNALHIMLNFDHHDQLTLLQLQNIAMNYMERIGFGDQPYLVYNHKDASHQHLHIVTTNLKPNGKRISIHNIGKLLSEPARKVIESSYGLVKAEGKNASSHLLINDPLYKAIYGSQPTKKTLNLIVNRIIKDYKFTSLSELNAVLSTFNVIADRGKEDSIMFLKKGLVYSILDEKGRRIGNPIKASELNNRPTLERLEQKFVQHRTSRMPLKQDLINNINAVLQKYYLLTKATFLESLAKKNIQVVFRQNQNGLTYGVTFIDHKNKTVFKGSDLGKDFSAAALQRQFADKDEPKIYLKAKTESMNYLKPIAENRLSQKEEISSVNLLIHSLLQKTEEDLAPSIGKKKKRKKREEQEIRTHL